ncbi:MAG: GDP-L-fucose synthase [Chitinophagaceae bacterium]|nr:MAG: GDP-L-fucose synthase [Chitinophagaceae bacterium]
MNFSDKIYIAGHKGMVGSAIHRHLLNKGYNNFLLRDSKETDLRNQQGVKDLFEQNRPDYVFLAAAKVGGIQANNTYRADFIYDNLIMEANIIKAAKDYNSKKLLFLGSSCIYPKMAPQPLKEEYLLTGVLESTNEPYAIAKIAGIKLCDAFRAQYGCNFISAMPTNLYGPNDNYDLSNSHVLPALLRKFHEAKEANAPSVTIWGSGQPLREFLHVDDMAEACIFLMDNFEEEGYVNVGTGKDISIKDLAILISKITGFKGELEFDSSKPDGTLRKLMDVSKINAMGWKYSIELEKGIQSVYEAYKKEKSQ